MLCFTYGHVPDMNGDGFYFCPLFLVASHLSREKQSSGTIRRSAPLSDAHADSHGDCRADGERVGGGFVWNAVVGRRSWGAGTRGPPPGGPRVRRQGSEARVEHGHGPLHLLVAKASLQELLQGHDAVPVQVQLLSTERQPFTQHFYFNLFKTKMLKCLKVEALRR
ncbi:Hypothetical predicted protein [Olea europaea subsp. europaea]|uniref:Uncharacterized protein n=1 Tax=Olea europaea subsp. europaea TaxID=158383 RepID=A0A8S0UI29_OLEEU|nr:Hypothetical predicted protein [Olea europaea subsp. europaea]